MILKAHIDCWLWYWKKILLRFESVSTLLLYPMKIDRILLKSVVLFANLSYTKKNWMVVRSNTCPYSRIILSPEFLMSYIFHNIYVNLCNIYVMSMYLCSWVSVKAFLCTLILRLFSIHNWHTICLKRMSMFIYTMF